MEQIKEWVYDPNSAKRLDFRIKSASVRKCLDKQVKAEYMGSGIFSNSSRASTYAYAEKTKRFQQKNFLRGFAKKNIAWD